MRVAVRAAASSAADMELSEGSESEVVVLSEEGDSDGEGRTAEGLVEENAVVREVVKWKRVRGTLQGLVRWEAGAEGTEWPLEWKQEKDLGAAWVRKGRQVLAGRKRCAATRGAARSADLKKQTGGG